MVTLSHVTGKPRLWPSEKHQKFLEEDNIVTGWVSPTLQPSERYHELTDLVEAVRLRYHDAGTDVWHLYEPIPGRNIRLISGRRARGLTEGVEPGQTPIASIYAAATKQNPHIGSSPNILGGKPCIKGTRIPVALLLRYLAVEEDPTEDLDITKKDVRDCLKFAATVCDQPTRHAD